MPDDSHVSFNDSITLAQRDTLVARLRTAWANLPPAEQATLKPMLDNAHHQLDGFLHNGTPPDHHSQQTLRMKSYLVGDWDGHLAKLGQPLNHAVAQPLAHLMPSAAVQISVGPEGDIFGTGKYEQLDPRWELVAGTVWLENILHKHAFPQGTPAILPMADNASFALASDWGTGNFGSGDSPSTKIGKFIPSLHPDYTIHLGDVYYAGTGGEETGKLIDLWPRGAKGSFALNSNHEMYSGGGPYFNQTVGGPVFNKLQSPFSFFALENAHWIVVGLDSAYFASAIKLYMDATLGKNNAQIPFLTEIAKRGKKVIVLTHHNPLPVSGVQPNPPYALYTEVIDVFAGHPAPAFWYYGHAHVGAAYTPLAGSGTQCRCIGHSALPWGLASDLQTSKNVQWFEHCNAGDPDNKLRVFNGFVHLQFNGPDLIETFYDETGRVAWRPGTTDTRCR